MTKEKEIDVCSRVKSYALTETAYGTAQIKLHLNGMGVILHPPKVITLKIAAESFAIVQFERRATIDP
jgi:hypothetical protein